MVMNMELHLQERRGLHLEVFLDCMCTNDPEQIAGDRRQGLVS